MQENQSLKRANSDKEKNIHQLKKAFQKIQSDYQNELNNLEFFKQKYSDIISEITDVKRKYLKEAKQSLKQFKKQNE